VFLAPAQLVCAGDSTCRRPSHPPPCVPTRPVHSTRCMCNLLDSWGRFPSDVNTPQKITLHLLIPCPIQVTTLKTTRHPGCARFSPRLLGWRGDMSGQRADTLPQVLAIFIAIPRWSSSTQVHTACISRYIRIPRSLQLHWNVLQSVLCPRGYHGPTPKHFAAGPGSLYLDPGIINRVIAHTGQTGECPCLFYSERDCRSCPDFPNSFLLQ
jgi:hypothetical protein